MNVVLVYVGAVSLAAAAVTAWLVLTHRFHLDVIAPGVFWPGGSRRFMFAAFVLVGELFPITVPRGDDSEEVTTSTTFAFALVLGWGTGWGLVALVGSSVIADLVHRKQLRKIFFNAGQYALAISAAGFVYSGAGGTPMIGMGDLLPVLAAGTTFFAVNLLLTVVPITLTQRIGFFDHVRSNIGYNLSVAGVLLSMSPIVVVVAEQSPALVPLLAFPLVAIHIGASAALKSARLQELNQLKDDFVAMVSHELRTPLTSIQGSVKTLIQLGTDLDDEQRLSFLEAVDRQSDRLRRLIERLLVVARLEADAERVSFSPVPLRTLCEYVVFELRPTAGAHSFQFDFEPDLVEIETDEGKVHQILSNLAENSMKYARADSRITLRCRTEPDAVLLMVEDQGPGIPEEARDHIFDRFYQVDQTKTRHVGGTGLGLYICRKLAEAIGATLSLDPEYDAGCRFVLRVPRGSTKQAAAPQDDIAVEQRPPSGPQGNGNGHRPLSDAPLPEPTRLRGGSEEITRGRVVAFLSTTQEL